MLQMMPYVNDHEWKLLEQSYDALKMVFNEEFQDLKITWKISYLVTWKIRHYDFKILKSDLQIGILIAWETKKMMLLGEQETSLLKKQEIVIQQFW